MEGVGSGMLESGSHSSCVSNVVSSVSVEPAECARWLRCCGVEHDVPLDGFPPAVDGSNSLRQVHFRSMPVHGNREEVLHRFLCLSETAAFPATMESNQPFVY